MTNETRITIRKETALECTTVAAIGCDQCPNGRLVVAKGMGGLATARHLTGRVPYEAAVSAQVTIDGAKTTLHTVEKAVSYSDTQPNLQPCPPNQCGYAEQVTVVATELQTAMTGMGLNEVRNIADPRPR